MISRTRGVIRNRPRARAPGKTSRTRTMVPPGGTAHIAGGADPADSGTMRAPRPIRRARGPRGRRTPRPVRIPGAVLVLLGCLPGLAAAAALPLCAAGIERTVDAHARPVAARPAVAHPAARPHIVPRSAWAVDSARTRPPPRYDDKVVAVFVHHTDSPNDYDCADAPRVIRDLAAGQTGTREWDDIGYNFLVDRCGTVYEGRAGGADRPVTGAHTQGFNHRTAGIAALGTFTTGVTVPQAMADAIAALAAWKLSLADIDPRARVRLTSSNSHSRYAAGSTAALPALAGHNDGYMTSCPGAALSARLPEIRERAARLQGRK
ncbi:peptidoglycan recognition protein [Streptomyces sp. NL15-2K]|uniref:peptidoglycan recognition protein family protein n=2 Tax=Streptomyces sp. NL15-2K TaxID=376149 RepID=UPI00209C081B|nr:peptidoglycan recognition protein [Streptomyces sp. NL15-2K]